MNGKCSVILSVFVAIGALGCQPKHNKSIPDSISGAFGERNKPPSEITSAEVLAKFDNADGLILKEKLQCAVDICGPIIADEKMSETLKAETKKLYSTLSPLLDSAFVEKARATTTLLKKIDSVKNEFADLKLETKHKALINYLWALSYGKQISSAWQGDRYNSQEVRAILGAKLSEAEIVSLEKMLTLYLKSEENDNYSLMSSLGYSDFIRKISNSDDPSVQKETARKFAIEIKTKIDFLQKELPLIFHDDAPAATKIAEGKEADPADLDDFANEIGTAYIYSVLNENIEVHSSREINIGQLTSDFYFKVYPQIKADLRPEEIAAQKGQARFMCLRTSLHLAEMKGAEATLKQVADGMIETVRRSAINTIGQFTDDQKLVSQLKERVKTTTFGYPAGTEVRFRRLEKAMTDQAKEAKEISDVVARGTAADLLVYLAFGNFLKDENEFQDISDTCSEQDPETISDRAYSTRGVIAISWMSLKNSAHGLGVIAHEFGHVVSGYLNSKKYLDLNANVKKYDSAKTCVAERHGTANLENATDEEDFADLFAAKVVVDLQKSTMQIANYGCLLLGNSSERYGTRAGISLVYPEGTDDTHSTAFFRLLQMELDTGKPLSPSCESVVDGREIFKRRMCL